MTDKHASVTVSASIDANEKKEATRVLESTGLTPATAFRIMMRRIAVEGKMPFDVFVPNAETVEAIEAVRRGEVTTCNSIEELFESLNSDD
jgi:DNA-damage-inducible protein J